MLSALCALKCGDGTDSFEAAAEAAETWRHCAERAGETVDEKEEGIGSFQIRLLDALSLKMEMERGRRMEVQSRMKQRHSYLMRSMQASVVGQHGKFRKNWQSLAEHIR